MASEREREGFFAEGVKLFGGIYDAVMAGGEIQASVRQGFRELGNAFGQMWPDQITVVEPGAIFNPLYSDIAAERAGHDAGLEAAAPPSPSAIASRNALEIAAVGNGRVDAKLPSPSDIANEQRPYTPQPDRGNGQDHGHER